MDFAQFVESAELRKTWIRCGDTKHLMIASSDEELERLVREKERKLLRANGDALQYPDGRSVHVMDEEIYPYEWSPDGMKVRARRVRYDKSSSGEIVKTVLKNVWVSPE